MLVGLGLRGGLGRRPRQWCPGRAEGAGGAPDAERQSGSGRCGAGGCGTYLASGRGPGGPSCRRHTAPLPGRTAGVTTATTCSEKAPVILHDFSMYNYKDYGDLK